VLLSSHVVAELERIADYLIVLSGGQVQMAGDVDGLLASHLILTGPTRDAAAVGQQFTVVHAQHALTQAHLLVRFGPGDSVTPPGWQPHPVALEELILAYLREPQASALPGPTAPATTEVTA
jgi:ABC-2 type transport system ATP-binding protein